MPRYTMRLTWPNDDRPNDYVFKADGRDAGRCYRMHAAYNRTVWLWTVYGRQAGGMADTLEEAQRKFKTAFEAATNGRSDGRPS